MGSNCLEWFLLSTCLVSGHACLRSAPKCASQCVSTQQSFTAAVAIVALFTLSFKEQRYMWTRTL
jgi:hypothetical protein